MLSTDLLIHAVGTPGTKLFIREVYAKNGRGHAWFVYLDAYVTPKLVCIHTHTHTHTRAYT